MWRTHEKRVPWKSELPRGTRMVRVGESLMFHYPRRGVVLTVPRWQLTRDILQQVWAAMPPHGRRHAARP